MWPRGEQDSVQSASYFAGIKKKLKGIKTTESFRESLE